MSSDWVNIRFGVYHLHIGKWYIKFEINGHHVRNTPKKFFEIYSLKPFKD